MWKKAGQNKQNFKKPESRFLGTNMCVHTRGMRAHPMCMRTHITSMHKHARSMCTHTRLETQT